MTKMNDLTRSSGRKRSALIFIALLFLAFVIRIVGTDYGYFHGDERINDAAKVLTGQLVPGQHFYPPFLNYLNAIGFGFLYVIGRGLDFWSSTSEFRAQYFLDPTPFYVTARYITAMIGALSGPFFYLIARRLRMPILQAQFVGLLGVMIPIAIFMSHIAKGDTALSTMAVIAVWALIVRHQSRGSVWADVLLGVVATLALSFKHSYVFVLGPMVIVHLLMLWQKEGIGAMLRSLVIPTVIILVLWPILNIGIILDLENFITYQKIQGFMSIREESSYQEAFNLFIARCFDYVMGINPIISFLAAMTPVYLLSPLCKLTNRRLLAGIWLAQLVSIAIMLQITGNRQPEHLWLPQLAVMQLFAGLVLADMLRDKSRLMVALATTTLVATLSIASLAAYTISKQALARPVMRDVEELVAAKYPDRKIQSMLKLQLPKKREADAWEMARFERLAQKYNSPLPERAAERTAGEEPANSVYFVETPVAMWGLENVTDEQVGDAVEAHAWPLQAEEWKLDYWLAMGVDMFITRNLPEYLNETPSQLYRDFFGELVSRCVVAHQFQPSKPLFLEAVVDVIDCKDAK